MSDLPPLPKANIRGPTGTGSYFDGYTDDQMREYGALCRKQALEEAAKTCIDERRVVFNPRNPDYVSGYNEGCSDCMMAIQGMI